MPEANKPQPAWFRRRPVRIALVALTLAVTAIILWLIFGRHSEKSANAFTGYVVTENIYMSSPVSGTLTSVAVRRGERISKGATLFRVDPTVREAQTEQARAQIAGSQGQLAQQRSALDKARDDLAAAQADADRYGAQLKHQTDAQSDKAGSVARLDIEQSRASYQSALGQRNAAQAQVASAVAAIAVAEAQLRQSQAGLTSAQRQLSDLSPVAPGEGRVEDVMFKPGESVNANVPIVSIVPDGEIKVRFYVPEYLVNAYKPGRRVVIGCDGCPGGMSATVNFVASRPEYTPPVIYSLDARQKLVFLVEALPSNPQALVPGQPMDVGATADDLPQR
jgi:HlyD family secretion protein